MISHHTYMGFAFLALATNSISCAPKQTATIPTVAVSSPNQPTEPIDDHAGVKRSPGNALASFGSNKFEGPWSVSWIGLGPARPAFGKGDTVKVKATPNGVAMTVETVPSTIWVDSRYYSDSLKDIGCYRCRWKNKDGSDSSGDFREEELERVPIEG